MHIYTLTHTHRSLRTHKSADRDTHRHRCAQVHRDCECCTRRELVCWTNISWDFGFCSDLASGVSHSFCFLSHEYETKPHGQSWPSSHRLKCEFKWPGQTSWGTFHKPQIVMLGLFYGQIHLVLHLRIQKQDTGADYNCGTGVSFWLTT